MASQVEGTERISATGMANIEAILQSYLSYPTGWDSYRGLPLRKDVYDLTREVLNYLHNTHLPEPYHIALGSRGTVQLTWYRDDWEMEIEITGQSVIICQQFTAPNEIVEYEVRRGLPKSLLSVTDWFTR